MPMITASQNRGFLTVTGGSGADVFEGAFGGSETSTETWPPYTFEITDFTPGVDRLQFAGLGLATIGGNAFSGAAGELRWSLRGGLTVVEADLDGDGIADLSILLEQAPILSEADFIL